MLDDHIESNGFVFSLFVLGAVALVGWIAWEVM